MAADSCGDDLMPICQHCNLGLPPTFVVCPDCGRKLVRSRAHVALDEQIDVIEIRPLSELLIDDLPEEARDDTPLAGVFEVGSEASPIDPGPHVENIEEDGEPDSAEVVVEKAEISVEPEPEPELEPVKESRPRRARAKRSRTRSSSGPRKTKAPAETEVQPDPTRAKATKAPRRKKRLRRATRTRELAPASEGPLVEHDDQLVDEGRVEVSSEQNDPEEDLFEDQFVGTSKGFSSMNRDAEARPSSPTTALATRPVRWAHRAYRGEIEVSATGSGTATLAVFGDGLLLIGSSGSSGGLPGSVRGLLSGSSSRKRQKLLNLAGSSVAGQSSVPGSRRLEPSEIESVRLDKASAWQRELTIRTTSDETIRYRFPSKNHRRLADLLAPVLGGKLLDSLMQAK